MMVTKPYGFSPRQIGLMTPNELKPYEKCYQKEQEIEIERISYIGWINGIYVMNAFNASVIGNSDMFSGKSKIEYPHKPISFKDGGTNNDALAVMEMKNACAMWESSGLSLGPK